MRQNFYINTFSIHKFCIRKFHLFGSCTSMPPKRKSAIAAEVESKRAKADPTGEKFGCTWSYEGELLDTKTGIKPLLIRHSNVTPGCEKVASFDIDWTLTATKSGGKFAKGASDWKWIFDVVPEKLKALNADGYRVVLFTNQAGIEKMKVKPKDVMDRVDALAAELNIPLFAFVCTGTNHYRKPATAMWDSFVSKYNKGCHVDLTKSFYVGDAAGRAKEWAPGKPKDFSCSDRMFAANIGIDFKTPEEFFLAEKVALFNWHSPNPKDLTRSSNKKSNLGPYHSQKQELIVMVGLPASGKSTFVKRHLLGHGYVHVNRDTLGTAAKCAKAVREALEEGKSVVVDNTNPSKAARAEFLELAKDAGVPCRCFILDISQELANHLNFVRMNQTSGKVRRIPDVGYNVYKKNFAPPTIDEGFSEILKIPFDPHFESDTDQHLFYQWTA